VAGAETISADYAFPYLAHAPMEPLNVVIDYTPERCEIWTGTQWPDGDRSTAARVLGLRADDIVMHTLPSGGSFGRRASFTHDFVDEAAQLALQLQQPVKLMWTREDDIAGGHYRPAAVCRLAATLDRDGRPNSWGHRLVVQSLLVNALIDQLGTLGGSEANSARGADTMPYAIANVRVDVHSMTEPVSVLSLRSVSNSFNVYAVETFIDELAQAAGADPYAYRRQLLQEQPRLLAVLDAAADAAGWASSPPAGIGRGIAVFAGYGSYIAQIVEASVDADRRLKLHRVVSAVDCGLAVHPDLVVAQIESSIVFALSMALSGEITLEQSVPRQHNFDGYPVLRMHQSPRMETVLIGQGDVPTGVGELGVPAVAPALANAIFAAIGERIRTLPMKHALKVS
jgi:isoquinoline 1-oxidoreductase beta subunit